MLGAPALAWNTSANRLDAFVVGTDSHVYATSQQARSTAWAGWKLADGSLGGSAGSGGGAAVSTTLAGGSEMGAGESLRSPNGSNTLAMQSDGNLVVYTSGSPAWASQTGTAGSKLAMQGDGNLVIYSASNQAVWQSRTDGHAGAWLSVQDDGNVVVYDPAGHALWATVVPPAPPLPPAGFDYARRMGALNWEQAHAGSSRYNDLCETAVENAYGTSGQFPTATDAYRAQARAGQVHGDYGAPAGALVFFNGNSPDGHVGIAVGDGRNYWTTDGTIRVVAYSEGGVWRGWSYAPSGW